MCNFCVKFQTENQKALWQQILDIVNKTNLIDYTMDIRKRLQLGDTMPEVCFSVCRSFDGIHSRKFLLFDVNFSGIGRA